MGWKLRDASGKQIWPARVVADFYTDWVDRFGLNAEMPIDAANLQFVAAARHRECYFMGEWQGALAEFSVLVHLIVTKNVTPIFVFDGRPNPRKTHEAARRAARRARALAQLQTDMEDGLSAAETDVGEAIVITAAFTLACCKICEAQGMRFTVAAFEADAQLLAFGHGRVVSRDADMLALGATFWVQPTAQGGWQTGRGLVRSIDEPADPDYPLVGLVRAHDAGWLGVGQRQVLPLYCAVTGCDFTEEAAGVRNIGYATTIKVFENLQELTATSVANGLLSYASTKLCAEDTQRAVSGELAQRLQAVVDCFVCALYYGPTAEVKQLGDRKLVTEATAEAKDHMAGRRHPRTGAPLDAATRAMLDEVQPSELPFPKRAQAVDVATARLQRPVTECSAVDLKAFIAAHGGNISGLLNRAQLDARAELWQQLDKVVRAPLVDQGHAILYLQKLPKLLGSKCRISVVIDKLLASTDAPKLSSTVQGLLHGVRDHYVAKQVYEDEDSAI